MFTSLSNGMKYFMLELLIGTIDKQFLIVAHVGILRLFSIRIGLD